MKDKIASIKKTFNEALELLKSQKTEEAIAKMAEIPDEIEALDTASDEAVQKIQKTEEEGEQKESLLKTAQETITKQEEQLKKWADMFVSAENLQTLLADIKSGQEMLKTIETKVEALEKTATSRQVSGENITKTKEEVLSGVKIAS